MRQSSAAQQPTFLSSPVLTRTRYMTSYKKALQKKKGVLHRLFSPVTLYIYIYRYSYIYSC